MTASQCVTLRDIVTTVAGVTRWCWTQSCLHSLAARESSRWTLWTLWWTVMMRRLLHSPDCEHQLCHATLPFISSVNHMASKYIMMEDFPNKINKIMFCSDSFLLNLSRSDVRLRMGPTYSYSLAGKQNQQQCPWQAAVRFTNLHYSFSDFWTPVMQKWHDNWLELKMLHYTLQSRLENLTFYNFVDRNVTC